MFSLQPGATHSRLQISPELIQKHKNCIDGKAIWISIFFFNTNVDTSG